MARAHRQRELAVRIGNQPGDLARLLSTITEAGVNILAYCAYSERDEGVVQLVTENPVQTKIALEANGYVCHMNDVVLVRAADQMGAAAILGTHLGRAGVNIIYSYASSNGDNFHAVFKTNNDEEALRVLTGVALADTA